jgi:predicted membrane protein
MVIEADYRDFKRALETKRAMLSVLVAISLLPFLFDPLSINFSLLAMSVNIIVWTSWLLDTIGKIRELHEIDRQKATRGPS